MDPIYGKDFAFVYNDKWAYWGEKMWPFLRKVVKKEKKHPMLTRGWICVAVQVLYYGSYVKKGFPQWGWIHLTIKLCMQNKMHPDAKIIQGDIRKLSLSQTFDIITCMFDSLNYLTLKQDLGKVFHRVPFTPEPEWIICI